MNRYPYRPTSVTLKALQMVTQAELEAFEDALKRGHLPGDLMDKLDELQTDQHRDFYLKQQSLLIGRLLLAVSAQEYAHVSPHEGEKLLRILAYVRKEDDLIPDSWPGGMTDDHDLMRLTCAEMSGVLQKFKAWHLARQVPGLWTNHPDSSQQVFAESETGGAGAGVTSPLAFSRTSPPWV